MEVKFREIDPFNCWIWLDFANPPSDAEKSYVEGLFDSWYVIGRLGGFNAENLQAHEEGNELSWFNYDNNHSENCLPSLMHNLGQIEYNGTWGRCWLDLGTSDPLAIDVLINTFKQINSDVVELKALFIGGVNDEWDVDEHPDSIFKSND